MWPENHAAVQVFDACMTQWRIGMGGATGLDYTAVLSVMEVQGISDRQDCLARIRVLESEALDLIN